MSVTTIQNFEPDIVPGKDLPQRWNSTYDLLNSALKIKKSLTILSEQLVTERASLNFEAINEEDWEKVAEICNFLELFKQGLF